MAGRRQSNGPRASENHVSRRQFVRGIGATGAAAIAGIPLFERTAEAAASLLLLPRALQGPPPPETINTDAFARLSESLTGARPLDRGLAAQYVQRWFTEENPVYRIWKGPNSGGVGSLGDLIRLFESLEKAGPEKDARLIARIKDERARPLLKPVAEQVNYLWYLSAFFDRETKPWLAWKYGSAEQYERGLVWSVIRAHAPMTPGGPYGHWANPPQA